ncbi:ADP-ribosylation factor-like protein 16 isoform X2 [Pipistrellus kuhlii]|uniref:ADP-ribosylation factor-like protein 16 isoform X2 n=1 Tax=Pipistrellus kuhlii TaxID=59472 RepID=UPI00174F2ECC|nr:ADP-ribosylation factor-like protein 16 isoform X2 [Pipistrellus kuhlii]
MATRTRPDAEASFAASQRVPDFRFRLPLAGARTHTSPSSVREGAAFPLAPDSARRLAAAAGRPMSSPGGEARPMAAEPGAGLASPQGGATGAEPARVVGMCLLLGAAGVGKSLLVKRLQKLSSQDGKGDLGDPPSTRPTVGTNLTDIVAHRKITIRELGGCMGPIWSSYYGDCRALLLSASCAQLLGLLSAEPLADAPVLILFNKTDLSCYMTVEEMKSLIRLPDIIACATQTITVADVSARTGTGLAAVLQWLQDTHGAGR